MRISSALATCTVAFALALGAGIARSEANPKTTEPLSAEKAREAECSLGDLAADAARAAVNADLVLIQAGQLRETLIPKGDLTREALKESLSYPDEQVVLVTISGEQLWSALERSLSMLPKPSSAFLQVSGISAVFRSHADPGQRLDRVAVGGQALSRDKTYRTAMPTSLAKGALGYFRIFGTLRIETAGPPLGDALWSYAAAKRVISPPAEPRLRDLSAPNE